MNRWNKTLETRPITELYGPTRESFLNAGHLCLFLLVCVTDYTNEATKRVTDDALDAFIEHYHGAPKLAQQTELKNKIQRLYGEPKFDDIQGKKALHDLSQAADKFFKNCQKISESQRHESNQVEKLRKLTEKNMSNFGNIGQRPTQSMSLGASLHPAMLVEKVTILLKQRPKDISWQGQFMKVLTGLTNCMDKIHELSLTYSNHTSQMRNFQKFYMANNKTQAYQYLQSVYVDKANIEAIKATVKDNQSFVMKQIVEITRAYKTRTKDQDRAKVIIQRQASKANAILEKPHNSVQKSARPALPPRPRNRPPRPSASTAERPPPPFAAEMLKNRPRVGSGPRPAPRSRQNSEVEKPQARPSASPFGAEALAAAKGRLKKAQSRALPEPKKPLTLAEALQKKLSERRDKFGPNEEEDDESDGGDEEWGDKSLAMGANRNRSRSNNWVEYPPSDDDSDGYYDGGHGHYNDYYLDTDDESEEDESDEDDFEDEDEEEDFEEDSDDQAESEEHSDDELFEELFDQSYNTHSNNFKGARAKRRSYR